MASETGKYNPLAGEREAQICTQSNLFSEICLALCLYRRGLSLWLPKNMVVLAASGLGLGTSEQG